MNLVDPKHVLFRNYTGLTVGSDKRRAKVQLNSIGNIECLAYWADGTPLAAIRKDLKGLIISLGF